MLCVLAVGATPVMKAHDPAVWLPPSGFDTPVITVMSFLYGRRSCWVWPSVQLFSVPLGFHWLRGAPMGKWMLRNRNGAALAAQARSLFGSNDSRKGSAIIVPAPARNARRDSLEIGIGRLTFLGACGRS